MHPNLSRILCVAVIAVAVAGASVAALAMGDEEFVGPFASWANVKTSYGATGDGVTDDTAAIQRGLNSLGPNNPTLYFPTGTYRITQTLTLAGQQYVNVIGQDPANTTILWAGASGGTMLYINGVAYSRFNRLTFNGQGNAAIAVDQSWTGSGNYFDDGNEYADDVFENVGTGLKCGYLDYGCADTAMLRDQFINNTVVGITEGNFNALGMFVWYSLFQNNTDGVGNTGGAGNFIVYNSLFGNSTGHDINLGPPGGYMSFRNNYSIGSNQFISAGGAWSPNNLTLQGNTILDTTQPLSIRFGDQGPYVLIDNTVRSLATVTSGPVLQVTTNSLAPADLFSLGNTFTVSSPELNNGGHFHSVNDQIVARGMINPSPPTLPGTPPHNNRQIFEASPTGAGTACTAASSCSVQQAITNAANAEQSGAIHPVAHIRAGTYNINSTITVPANSGIQIIGDGGYSLLQWNNSSSTGPVIRLLGPSKVILRDFYVAGAGFMPNGIEVDNVDQPGSRVFMEQARLGGSGTNLFVDGLDYTNVELHNLNHTTATGTSINVIGGPSAAAGLWQGGATNIFAGATTENHIAYGASNGAHLNAIDLWQDAGPGTLNVANVTGTSTFTYASSAVYMPSSSGIGVSLNNFQGTAALANLNTNANINITGNGGTARVLGLGLVGPSATFFSNTSSPAATTEFLNSQADPTPGSGGNFSLPEQGCCDTMFLTATLNQLRTEQPTLLAPLPSSVTDIRFYRVIVGDTITGIHLQAASTAPPPLPPLPTASVSASPTSINAGQPSTLSWTSTNATSCTGVGFTASGTSGSTVVTPGATTTYSITCSGSSGSASATAIVNVTAPAPTASLSASPTSVKPGQSSILSWSSTNATSCTGGAFSTGGAISGSAVATPSRTTTYSVNCTGNTGTTSASATVTVSGKTCNGKPCR
jgi:hypothetical protein